MAMRPSRRRCHLWRFGAIASAVTVLHLRKALVALCFALPQVSPPNDVPANLFPAGSDFEDLTAQVHSTLEKGTADKAVCQDLLSKLAESGDPLLASRWLRKMRTCGMELDPGCYEAIVAAHCLLGLATEGEMIFEVHAKELASEGRHPSPASYGCLAETFAERGEVEKAQEYLNNMKSLGLPVEMHTYAAVIESLAKRGKSDAARRWLEESIGRGLTPSRQCFSATISAFAKESRLLEAEGVLKAMREANVDADVQTWGWLLMASHMPPSSRPKSRAKRKQSHTKPEDIFRQILDAGIVPDSFVLRALGKAVGLARREELCKEMGVDLSAVPGRPVRKTKTKQLQDAPRGLQWLLEDIEIKLMTEDDRYWSGSKLFKPDKDFGPRRAKRYLRNQGADST